MQGIDGKVFVKPGEEAADDPLAVAQSARSILRPCLTLLVLAARRDGHFHREELDAIPVFAEWVLMRLDSMGRAKVMVTLRVLDAYLNVARYAATSAPPSFNLKAILPCAAVSFSCFCRKAEGSTT